MHSMYVHIDPMYIFIYVCKYVNEGEIKWFGMS